MRAVALSVLLFLLNYFSNLAADLSLHGNLDFSAHYGQEETFLSTVNGISKADSDLQFQSFDLGMNLDYSRRVGALKIKISDRMNLDLYSQDDLIFRDSNGSNYLQFEGQAILAPGLRLKGGLQFDTFEDRSFVEYSNEDRGTYLEAEYRLRPRVFMHLGYEAHNREFDVSTEDDYSQRDLYLGYYRLSPAKTTLKPFTGESYEMARGALQRDQFSDPTRDRLMDGGFPRVASLIPEKPRIRGIYGFFPYTVDAPMAFEIEARLRHRDLLNFQQRSYIEGQINSSLQFFIGDDHDLRIEEQFSDRDYGGESLPDNLLSYQRNIAHIAHYVAWPTIRFDTSLELDNTFYKSRPAFDSFEWEFQSSVSWDLVKRLNLSWFHVFSGMEYENPREFFTNWDYELRSFISTIKMGEGFTLKGNFDREKKDFKFFENSVDSSYGKRAQDYRLIYSLSKIHQIHCGYRWERERHVQFVVNDRYEELGYVGTKISF